MVLVQSIRDQTSSRVAPQIGRGFSSKTQRIQPAPDWLRILLRNGRGFSLKSKWIKFAPGRLLLGSNVHAGENGLSTRMFFSQFVKGGE